MSLNTNMMKLVFRYTTALLILVILLASCEEKQSEEPKINTCIPTGVPGELVNAEYIMPITSGQVKAIIDSYLPFNTFDFEELSVEVYSVSYKTQDKNDELIPVSGVMFVPVGIDNLDIVSTQHGTSIKRTDVGSDNFLNAIDGLLMSMQGCLVVAPDYIGLGESDLLHPYLHAELSANAVIDMIRAGRAFACDREISLSDRVLLSGYSEGGYVTLATQKIMETEFTEEFDLLGVAPMAGPFDLLGTTRSILNQDSYENPALLAYLVTAYNDVYDWDRLDDVFQEPYASLMPKLFDGTIGADSINSQLPNSIDSLFLTNFKQSFLAGNDSTIEAALIANAFEGWGPIAPVRLIHGTDDDIVPFENSEFVYSSMLANGGVSVDLVPLLGADHLTGAIFAYELAGVWFDSLRAND